jgi:tetratricopeptide (TPR) repeat protein
MEKQSNRFQIGDEILPHIIEMGSSESSILKSLKGKTIVMVFATTSQEFSQKALQDVQTMIDRLPLKGFKAIGIVSSSKGSQEVQNLIEKSRLNYPVIFDEEDLIAQLRILVYPTTLIIDRNGRLAYYYALYASNYYDQLSAQLKRIIEDKEGSYLNEEMVKKQQKEEIKKAREEIARGNVEDAVTTLTNLLQKGHDSYELHLLLGYSLIKVQQPEKALSHFKKAKEMQHDSTIADLGLGIAYSRSGEIANAFSLLNKTVKNDPDSLLAYRELSHIFEEKGELDKAIYYIKKELDCLIHRIKD